MNRMTYRGYTVQMDFDRRQINVERINIEDAITFYCASMTVPYAAKNQCL